MMYSQTPAGWYRDRVPQNWFEQPDVFAFRCNNGMCYSGTIDTTVVDSVWHIYKQVDRSTIIRFKPGSTPGQRNTVKNSCRSHSSYSREYKVVTQQPDSGYAAQQWYIADQRIIVQFMDAAPSTGDFMGFIGKYKLIPILIPSYVPASGPSLPYIFLMDSTKHKYTDPVALCKEIIEHDSDKIWNAEPDFVNYRYGQTVDPTTLANCGGSSPYVYGTQTCPGVNDPELSAKQWHIDPLLPGIKFGICDCWNAGYTGKNINIALIAPGMPYYDPNTSIPIGDLRDPLGFIGGSGTTAFVNEDAYDCSTGTCNKILFNTPGNERIVPMMGAINARGSNNYCISGVAPDVKVLPFGTDFSAVSVIAAINQLITERLPTGSIPSTTISLVVMPFAYDVASYPAGINSAIIAALGVVRTSTSSAILISPSGLLGSGITAGALTYPYGANTIEYIGVISSDKTDHLYGGSNYSSAFDIAVPGKEIWSLWEGAPVGAGGLVNISPDGEPTALATAVAAGIAAILLEKDPTMSGADLKFYLRNGAEKVTYTYTGGISNEFAYGRVHCHKSLNLVVGLDGTLNQSDDLTYATGDHYVDLYGLSGVLEISMNNIIGQEISTGITFQDDGSTRVQIPETYSGMGVLYIQSANRSWSLKVIF